MIINNSYFLQKPVFIPQAQTSIPEIGDGQQTLTGALNDFINEKEYELLLSFLGYEQTFELLDQFDANGDWKPTALQKWKDLVDGKEDWRGLRMVTGERKTSLIAFYVYFYWLSDDNTTYSTVGVQKPESANSTWKTPNDYQVKVWDMFLRMYGNYYRYTNWPTFFTNWNGMGMVWRINNQDANNVTLYDFMTKNNDVYDVTKFAYYQPVNAYNL